ADFTALAQNTDAALGVTQATVDAILDRSTLPLPIVGTAARDLRRTFDQAFSAARGTLQGAVSLLDPQSQAWWIRQSLADALSGAGILADRNGDGTADAGDVAVSDYDPESGSITVELGLAAKLADARRFNFNLGLPSLPFQVTSSGDIQAEVGLAFNTLRFGA